MGDKWIDISGYQIPELMHWHEWNIPRGQYRLFIGRTQDARGFLHRVNMRAAGMKTGSYAVPVEYAPIVDQAQKWIDNIPSDDENDDWVDAERVLLTEPMLRAYCDEYDRRSPRQRLAIYTGNPWWNSHIPLGDRSRYAGYKLIIASYPFDSRTQDSAGNPIPVPMDLISVSLRTNPPINRRPAIPSPWITEDGWQYTGQGSEPGYPKFLDHGIYRVNPDGVLPTPDFDLALKASLNERARTIIGLVS